MSGNPQPAQAALVSACSGVSLPQSVVTDIVGQAVVPVTGILDNALGLLIGPLGLSTNLSGTLASIATGNPITLNVLDVNGQIVNQNAPCASTADSFELTNPKGISIGGNKITGLGANTIANAGEINSIALGNNAVTDPTAANSIAIGPNANIGAGATNAVVLGSGTSATAANSVAIGPASVASGVGSFAAGNSATASGAGSIAIGQNASSTGVNSIAIGTGAVATGSVAVGAGAQAGNGGAAFGDNAVALAPLQGTAIGTNTLVTSNGGVALGAGSQATRAGMNGAVEKYSGVAVTSTQGAVSVGTPGNERQITNVAGGTAPTDAVNVRQLDFVMSQTNTGINNQINTLRNEIGDVRRDANAGSASAMAMASMPQSAYPGRSMVAAGAATYDGQSALSIGFSKLSDNGRWVFKLGGAANTRGNAGAGVGVGFHW